MSERTPSLCDSDTDFNTWIFVHQSAWPHRESFLPPARFQIAIAPRLVAFSSLIFHSGYFRSYKIHQSKKRVFSHSDMFFPITCLAVIGVTFRCYTNSNRYCRDGRTGTRQIVLNSDYYSTTGRWFGLQNTRWFRQNAQTSTRQGMHKLPSKMLIKRMEFRGWPMD